MRTKRAFWNISTSMIYLAINTICGFIVPRLIISTYGSAYNGVVASAARFLSMINILTIGIAGPTRVALYKAFAANDHDGVSGIVKATRSYMRKVAVGVIIYSVILMFILPHVIQTDINHTEVIILICIVSISTFAQYFFSVTNHELLSADQSVYITNIFNAAKVVINTILTVVFIKMRFSIFAVKGGSAVIYFICPFILNLYIKKHYKLNNHCKPNYSAIKGRKAAVYHSVANIIHDNTDVTILTVLTDIKTVSVYSVYSLVTTGLRNLLKVFTSAMESPFGALWALDEKDKLRQNFNSYEFGIMVYTSIVFSCAFIMINPFIATYTAGVYDINYQLPVFAFLCILGEMVFCIRQPFVTLVHATGDYEATKKHAVYEAAINLITSIIGVLTIGINGVMLGTLLANLYRTIVYVIFCQKHYLFEGYKRILIRLLLTTISIGTSVFIVNVIIYNINWQSGWLGCFIQGIIALLISTILTIAIFGLACKSDMMEFIKVIRTMLHI